MAHSKNNVITRTYSGRFGNTCLQANGVLRSLPDMSKRVLSEKQGKHLSRFERAKAYGRKVVADDQQSAFYAGVLKKWKKKKKNVGIYQLAIMDFMNPPAIVEVNLVKTFFKNGCTINIAVIGKFDEYKATVSIITPDGLVLEEGEARQLEYLKYVIRDPSQLQPGLIVRVRAWGMPGIVTERDFHQIFSKSSLSLL